MLDELLLDEGLLDRLGRIHTRQAVFDSFDLLRRTGFENINLDLMFAIPGQSQPMWLNDLRHAIDLQPEHLSTYCLTFEEDTAMWLKLSAGHIRRDVDHEADLYLATWDTLAEHGYTQYEISNFTRRGYQCIHNINTWNMCQWYGLGPSAASQYRGMRFANPSCLDTWLAGIKAGELKRNELSVLSDSLLACDCLVFGLRMNAGVDLGAIGARFPQVDLRPLQRLWGELVEQQCLVNENSRIRLTAAGRLLADRIGVRIMEIME